MSCCNNFPDPPDFNCGRNYLKEVFIPQRLTHKTVEETDRIADEFDEIEIKMLYVTMKMCAQNNDYERAAAIQGMILDRISIDSLFA